MTHIVFDSGGAASYIVAKRVAEKHGTGELVLLFTDTRSEDADLYRFLIEGAASVVGRLTSEVRKLAATALTLPEPWEDEAGRREGIASLQAACVEVLPELKWLSDGRDLWQTFDDERMVGNARVDVCAKNLKRAVSDAWIKKNFTPQSCILYVGIDSTEPARYLGDKRRPGIKKLWEPWQTAAPLIEESLTKCEMLLEIQRDEINPPRLYDDGFPHNNCGGFCVKAGHAHFLALMKRRPQLFMYHAEKEQWMRERLNKDVAIMKDRRGGKTVALPMLEFKRQVEMGERHVNPREWGKGCQCFFSDEAEESRDEIGADVHTTAIHGGRDRISEVLAA